MSNYYCLLSLCSVISVDEEVIAYTNVATDADIQETIDQYHYHGDNRMQYCDDLLHIIKQPRYMNTILDFSDLSLNYDCCQLYIYITDDPERISIKGSDTHVRIPLAVGNRWLNSVAEIGVRDD